MNTKELWNHYQEINAMFKVLEQQKKETLSVLQESIPPGQRTPDGILHTVIERPSLSTKAFIEDLRKILRKKDRQHMEYLIDIHTKTVVVHKITRREETK